MPAPLVLAPLIAGLIAALSRMVFSKGGAWVAAALVFLGLELAAYNVAIAPLRDEVASRFSALPAAMLEWMGVLNLDMYATILCSAYAASVVKRVLLRRRVAP